jgi:hypothetical protein
LMHVSRSDHTWRRKSFFNNIAMVKVSKRLEELANKMLDGQLSQKESLELEELVSASAEARTYLEQMQQLHSSLTEAALESKNIEVSQEVMKRVGGNTGFTGPTIIRTLLNRNTMRYAAILVIGLLLGSMLTYVMLSDLNRINRVDARATLTNQGNKSYFYSGAGWMINFNHYALDNQIGLIVISRAEDSIDVHLSFNPQAYKIENASCVGCSFATKTDTFRGLIDFTVSGEVVYKVLLNNITGIQVPVLFEIKRKGELLYNGEIFIR